MNRFCRIALFGLVVAAALAPCVAVLHAQTTNSTASSAPQKVELLPGLDKQLIDSSADPCANFYQYACGNFSKLYPIPPDKSSYGSFEIVYDYTQEVLHGLLDQVAEKSGQHTANEQKIGDYYASCMDEDAIDAKGLKPLQPELDRIAALSSKKELTDLLAHYQMINVGAFFSYGEQQDFKDARNRLRPSIRADSGFRSATITSALATKPRRRARNTWSTWRRCWSCWASPQRRLRPMRKRS